MKLAVRYGKGAESKHVRLGEGLVGWAALHKEPVLVSDVSQDPRYINLVDDARSELVIPMLIKDRCIGVFDLESPELDAFTKEHKELLTLLASQAAVAIENARLYEEVRRNEERIEKELRFAQRVQMALLPTELPRQLDERRRGRPLRAGARARRRPPRLPGARAEDAGRRRRRRVGQGRAGGALRRASPPSWCARGRCAGASRRSCFSVSGVLQAMNTILHERQLEEYYCTLCYALLRLRARRRDAVQLGAAVSDPLLGRRAAARSSCRACRSARLPASPTTRSSCRCGRTTCSCSAPTASSRR